MTRTLERALAEVAALPDEAQDKIGRDLLAYLEKLGNLRRTIEASIEGGGSFSDDDIKDYTERLHANAEREGR